MWTMVRATCLALLLFDTAAFKQHFICKCLLGFSEHWQQESFWKTLDHLSLDRLKLGVESR